MDRAIEAKKDQLFRRKPGSVKEDEPRIIWINMIDRVNGRSQILAHRHKYNRVVENILASKEKHHIMDINAEIAEPGNYNQFNRLNDFGKARFWLEVDKQIELFEKAKIMLKPVQIIDFKPQKHAKRELTAEEEMAETQNLVVSSNNREDERTVTPRDNYNYSYNNYNHIGRRHKPRWSASVNYYTSSSQENSDNYWY